MGWIMKKFIISLVLVQSLMFWNKVLGENISQTQAVLGDIAYTSKILWNLDM